MREKAPGACALAMAKLKLLKIPFSRNSSETPRHPRLHYFRIGDNSELPRVVFRNRGRNTCHGLWKDFDPLSWTLS